MTVICAACAEKNGYKDVSKGATWWVGDCDLCKRIDSVCTDTDYNTKEEPDNTDAYIKELNAIIEKQDIERNELIAVIKKLVELL